MDAAITRATDLLTHEEIRSYTRRSDLQGLRAVLVTWSLIAGSFAVLAWLPHPVTFVIAVVVLGGRQLALAVLMHEAAHGTLFRTRWLNDVFASWVCARPVWSDI